MPNIFQFFRGWYICCYIIWKKHYYFAILQFYMVFSGCSPKQPEKDYTWLKQGIETAALQLKFTVLRSEIQSGCPVPSGRAMTRTFYVVSWIRNSWQAKTLPGWNPYMIIWVPAVIAFPFTIGQAVFSPAIFWLAYQLTGDESLRESAVKFTNYLYPLREYKGTHDIVLWWIAATVTPIVYLLPTASAVHWYKQRITCAAVSIRR